MSDERTQFGVLRRHFFGGFLDNDQISPTGDLHGPISKAVAVIAMIGILYPFKLLFTYGRIFPDYPVLDRLSWGDKCMFVTLSLVVMGLLTVLEWDALQLDRRDCRALGALPVRWETIIRAKLTALAQFLLVLSVPLTLIGALTFPAVMHAGWRNGWDLVAATMAGHAVATLAAAWCVFFALLGAQGAMLAAFGLRLAQRLSSAIQLVATLGFVVALLMMPLITASTRTLKAASAGAAGWAPQMWFLGIYQTIAGQGDADWDRLAARGWAALLLAMAVGLGATFAAYRRALRTTLEVAQSGGGRSIAVRVLDAVGWVAARHPVERGFYAFSVRTVLRSPWHRVVLAVFFGGALALALVALDVATYARDGVHRVPMVAYHALAMQFVILAIVLSGVRVAAASPAELRATWALRMLEGDAPRRWMNGFRKAVLAALIAPVTALMAAPMTVLYGWHAAWTLGIAAFVFAWLMFDVLFLGYGRVPFACPAPPPTGDAKIRGPLTVAMFTILVVPVAQLVTFALRSTPGTLTLLVFAAGTGLVLRWRANLAIARDGGLAFEPDDGATQTLTLGP